MGLLCGAPRTRSYKLAPLASLGLLTLAAVFQGIAGQQELTASEPESTSWPFSGRDPRGRPAAEPSNVNEGTTRHGLSKLGRRRSLQGSWFGGGEGKDATGQANDGSQSEDRGTQKDLPKEFIYVYDFGGQYTTDYAKAKVNYWSSQYEAEYEIHNMLAVKDVYRTWDPRAATLFYVPFFACRYLHVIFSDIAEENDNRKWSELHLGINATSLKFTEVLRRVRSEFPYFNRSNGRDHFSVLAQDHGRCGAITFMNPSIYREMFFLQLNGDKMVQSNFGRTARGMQALNYNWGAYMVEPNVPVIPCYMPDRDIVVPPVLSGVEAVDPEDGERPIQALFRFSEVMDHGVKIPFWGHHVRTELYELWSTRAIPGYDFGVKLESASRDDWKHAKFCVAPPGHSQWTSRLVKAILGGCIPVTFFREHDNPWQVGRSLHPPLGTLNAPRTPRLVEGRDGREEGALDGGKFCLGCVLSMPDSEGVPVELASSIELASRLRGSTLGARLCLIDATDAKNVETLAFLKPRVH